MNYYLMILIILLTSGVSQVKADRSPTLVLEPNNYSYNFSIPSEWTYSEALARKAGVQLLVIPSENNANPYRANIYVTQSCSKRCGVPSDLTIETMLDRLRRRHSNLQANSLLPVQTESGIPAKIWIFSELSYADITKEAIAFIDTSHAVVLATLSVRKVSTWESDYNAFIEFVSGFTLIDCQSKELEGPCE